MAIIQYTLVNGTAPNYITDGGYFLNPSDNTLIGIGSGGGTTLSKADLTTRVLSMHASLPWKLDGGSPPSETRNLTNDEVTAQINTWCTARGIS
jgi:hypothetical protein